MLTPSGSSNHYPTPIYSRIRKQGTVQNEKGGLNQFRGKDELKSDIFINCSFHSTKLSYIVL